MSENNRGNVLLAVLAFIAVLIIAVVMYRSVMPNTAMAPSATTTASLATTYYGVTPCADCPGIENELTITPDAPNSGDGTFSLKMTYMDSSVAPLVYSGKQYTLRGNSTDPNATILELVPSDGSQNMYYLVNSPTSVTQLDSNQNVIQGAPGMNFTLTTTPPTGTPAVTY